MSGLGNTFAHPRHPLISRNGNTEEAAKLIADPKTGPGCDQVITIEHRQGADEVFMGVWNADGSEVGACGNAARCVASLLMEENRSDNIEFTTLAGPLSASKVGDARISVDMGEPKLRWREIPLAEQMDDTRFIDIKLGPIDKPVLWGPSAVNVGNPHCIFFVEDAEDASYRPLWTARRNPSAFS